MMLQNAQHCLLRHAHGVDTSAAHAMEPHPRSDLQLCSYVNEYPTGRYLRDAKLYEIGAGTSGEASSPACLPALAWVRLPAGGGAHIAFEFGR